MISYVNLNRRILKRVPIKGSPEAGKGEQRRSLPSHRGRLGVPPAYIRRTCRYSG